MANPAHKEPYDDTDPVSPDEIEQAGGTSELNGPNGPDGAGEPDGDENTENALDDQPGSQESLAASNILDSLEKKTKPNFRFGLSRRLIYSVFASINLILVWAGAIAFIMLTPDKFVSEFTLLIPGSGTGSSLNLDNLGQASTSVNSAYSSSKVDPKTNYKAIAMSPIVLDRAAEAMEIDSADFGNPKIKLIDQTTLLEISFTSDTANSAYEKALQYYSAFEDTLNQLRTEELDSRRASFESILLEYKENVYKAQAEVLEFQQRTKIVSSDQYKDLLSNVESIKNRRLESVVKLNSTNVQLTQLEQVLEVNAYLAALALKLQNDSVFVSMVAKAAEENVAWVENQAVWGINHPKVKHARARVDAARSSLLNRAKALTGIDQHSILNSLYVQGDTNRAKLFEQLISLSANKLAIESEVETYTEQLDDIDKRLQDEISLAAVLEDLERNHQVATAIYVSAAAKSDLGNSDIYASYPMTQMLMPPTLDDSPDKFTKPIAIAGAAIGSILICLALLISWKRTELLRKLQKRN